MDFAAVREAQGVFFTVGPPLLGALLLNVVGSRRSENSHADKSYHA